MKTCIYSNRIYKDALDFHTNKVILDTIYNFNTAMRTAYNMVVKSELKKVKYDKSLHLTLKDKFGYNDYYTNSILREATGVYKSNIENWKLHIDSQVDKVKSIQAKIKSIEKTLKNKQSLLESVIKIHRASLNGKKIPKLKSYKGCRESLVDPEALTFQVVSRKRVQIYNVYEFEVCYLKPEIKNLKNRLRQLKYGLGRTEQKLDKLKNNPELTCFGGKWFFKNQFTKEEYIENHNLWKLEFDKKRNRSFQISGRKDAAQGNFVFRYNDATVTFSGINGESASIPKVIFPYGQDILNRALSATGDDRSALAWEIEDRGEFYIIKTMVELPKNKNINYSKSDGMVGLDINYDHLALVNVSGDGNFLGKKMIYFNIDGKSSNQITNILGNTIKKALAYCVELKKPLGMEKLDIEKSKSTLKYGTKNRNRKLTQFAYSQITQMIESRAYKDSAAVFMRNPAYSSQIGKLKYMKQKGISIHTAAAYVVGRRAMNFNERVPKCYQKYIQTIIHKHHWSHWRFLSKDLKSVHPKYFYKTIDFDGFDTVPKIKDFLINN